jgi:hypothetical protein
MSCWRCTGGSLWPPLLAQQSVCEPKRGGHREPPVQGVVTLANSRLARWRDGVNR